MENIEQWVYNPMWSTVDYHAGSERCCHKIFIGGCLGPYQCLRKSTRIVQGYGFCTQHAKMVERNLSDANQPSN